MSGARQLPKDDYLVLKTHTRRLIKRAGGLDLAAELTRVCKSVLSDYQNPAKLDCFMPADVIADLESFIGQSLVSQTLAEFAVDPTEPHRPIDCLHRMQGVVKESAEAAIAIGNGDTQEAIKEIEEAIAELEKAKRDILARQSRPHEVRDAS